MNRSSLFRVAVLVAILAAGVVGCILTGCLAASDPRLNHDSTFWDRVDTAKIQAVADAAPTVGGISGGIAGGPVGATTGTVIGTGIAAVLAAFLAFTENQKKRDAQRAAGEYHATNPTVGDSDTVSAKSWMIAQRAAKKAEKTRQKREIAALPT